MRPPLYLRNLYFVEILLPFLSEFSEISFLFNKVKDLGENEIRFPPNPLSYDYAKFHANLTRSDTENACLKRQCFGEIRYIEKLEKSNG